MNLAFLCGAGCEGKNQFEISNGSEFKKDIIKMENVAEYFSKLNPSKYQFLNKTIEFKVNNKKLIDARGHNILYQTLKEHPDFLSSLSKDNQNIYKEYNKYREDSNRFYEKDEKNKIKNDFKELYKKLLDLNDSEDNKMIVSKDEIEQFYNNISFCSYTDELFNYLRYPDLYMSEVSKVIKLYFAAYLSILKALETTTNCYVSERLENSNDYKINRQNLSTCLEEMQKNIVDNTNVDKTYYGIINNLLENSKKDTIELTIITTNYTRFPELVINRPENIVYIHGRLNFFEDIVTKQVEDITSFSEEQVIMPFIFIPSGVKPIVSIWQMEQYAKAVDAIKNADVLTVVGYGINSDDEHILNFLRERNSKGGHIKWFLYKDKGFKESEKKLYEIFDKALNFECIPFSEVSEFEEQLKKIISN